ncbi:MAG: hypothetical protein WD355_08910 [Balneolaceae bacterium]
MYRTYLLSFISLLLVAIACNEVFEPWQENDRYHFSIYGMLDATADTQWVRVMPVREELFLDPRPIDVTVTLEHIESGETTIMHDSLFSYHPDVYAWNFWTTMELIPEETYRLTASHPDGRTSYGETTLPPDFPTPVVQTRAAPIVVHIEGVERLVDTQVIFHGQYPRTGEIRILGLPYLEDTLRTATGGYQVFINPAKHRNKLVGFPPTLKIVIYVASGGPDYYPFGTMKGREMETPQGISNIRSGTGYLGGIVSKTVPYRSCYAEDGFRLVPCPLDPSPW